jgi:hypothetical protein
MGIARLLIRAQALTALRSPITEEADAATPDRIANQL